MTDKKQITTVSNGLLVRAPAKINLSLLVAGKRPDGFHEIETVMAKVDFFDEILIEQGQKNGIELLCRGPCWAPEGKENDLPIGRGCFRLSRLFVVAFLMKLFRYLLNIGRILTKYTTKSSVL